jgi:hypothetical protein
MGRVDGIREERISKNKISRKGDEEKAEGNQI